MNRKDVMVDHRHIHTQDVDFKEVLNNWKMAFFNMPWR
jgi:hypothetical protein